MPMTKKHHRFESEKNSHPDTLQKENEIKTAVHEIQGAQEDTSCKNDAENTAEKPEILSDEVQKWKDLAMRSQAEMENLRKRTQIDIEKANRYATASFAKELLTVADCLAGAIDCAQKEMNKLKEKDKDCFSFLENLLKGVEMTQKQLTRAFEQQGVKKMETLGLIFDPNLHKVIQEIEDGTKEPGTIVQELQSGYTICDDRVLREAMVIISK